MEIDSEFKLRYRIEICPNLSKLVQTYPNLSKLVQTCSNLSKIVRCALGQAWLDQDKNWLSCSKTRPGKQTPQSLSVGLMKEVKLDLCPRKHSGKWKLFWLSLIRDSCWREKEQLFSRNLSKKYPEKILGADGEFPKISGKRFEGRTDSSENILEGIWGVDGREIDWDL